MQHQHEQKEVGFTLNTSHQPSGVFDIVYEEFKRGDGRGGLHEPNLTCTNLQSLLFDKKQ